MAVSRATLSQMGGVVLGWCVRKKLCISSSHLLRGRAWRRKVGRSMSNSGCQCAAKYDQRSCD